MTDEKKNTQKTVPNSHLIGRKVKFVYEGNWNDLTKGAVLTISDPGVHGYPEGGIPNTPRLTFQAADGTLYENVSVEHAFFNYGGEDDPLFVILDN